MTVDKITVPLRAFLCHPHSNESDLCFSAHPLWLVLSDAQDDDPDEVIALVPIHPDHALDPPVARLRNHLCLCLCLCDYRGPLTVDDA